MAPEEGGEPIALFDMNSLSWTDTFSPQSSNYQWPWVVRSWYEAKYVVTDLALTLAWAKSRWQWI